MSPTGVSGFGSQRVRYPPAEGYRPYREEASCGNAWLRSHTSVSRRRVTRELTGVIERRCKPGLIVSDHRTEFTSNAMLACQKPIRSPSVPSRRARSPCRRAFARASIVECATRFSNEKLALRRRSCPHQDRELDRRLQRTSSTLGTRLPHIGDLYRHSHPNAIVCGTD
jgi:hypothetical protein